MLYQLPGWIRILQVCQGCKGGGHAPGGGNTASQAIVVKRHCGQTGKAVCCAPRGWQGASHGIAVH